MNKTRMSESGFVSVAAACALLSAGLVSGAVVRQQAAFSIADLKMTVVDGRAVPELSDCEPTDEVGAPQLVRKTVFVPLPEGARVSSVRLVRANEQEVASVFTPAAVQPPVVTMPGIEPKRVVPNPAVFAGLEPYPRNLIRFGGQGRLEGRDVAMVTLYPLRFLPQEHKLTIASEIEFEIEYELASGKWGMRNAECGMPTDGAFEYLVVTNAEMDTVFQRLADWKTTKGVRAAVRDIAWIEANYPGRDAAERLRNYLKACCPDSGLKWVLLGGDFGVVPLRYAFAMTCSAHLAQREDSLPCDLYFSDLDRDWDRNGNDLFGEVADSVDLFPEVYVGRSPVNNVAQAQVFVNKLLTYEQNPARDYENTALFCGEILWHDPYTDQGVAKDFIDDRYLPQSFGPVVKLYQSQGTEYLDTVLAEINRGRGFFNHDGHAWYDGLSVGGSPNYIRRGNMDAMSNAPRYGICYSIGCWAAAFDFDAVSEHYVLAPNGGGVAFIGNSSYGWGAPGNPRFGYSDRFDAEFYHQVFTQGIVSIGKALALDKVHFIPYSREENVYRWHQYDVNLLGDPEMPLWTASPRSLVLTVPAGLPVGTTRLLVLARDSLGRPAQDIRVCARKGSETYAVARTDASGQAALLVAPASAGTMTITATGADYVPRQTAVPVENGAYVAPRRIVIADSLGNSDQIANPGEDVFYRVWFRNDGNQPASGLVARLRYSGNLLVVTDSAASLPDLGPGDSARASFRFTIVAGARDRDAAYLSLVVSDNAAHTWTSQPAVSIGTPVLELESYRFSDSTPGGNGNGILEPGEDVHLALRVHNAGLGFGHAVIGTVESLDSNFVVAGANTPFGEVAPGASAASGSPVSVEIGFDCPAPYVGRLQVTEAAEGYSFVDTILVVVGNTGLDEEFESGAPGWETGGMNNLWYLSEARSHSGATSYYCGQEGNRSYVPNMDCWILSPRFMVGPGYELSFWRWFSVPIYGSDGLYVIVEHDSAGCAQPETLDYIGTGGALGSGRDGITSDWLQESYDLSHYDAGDTLSIRLGFKSDGDAQVGEGFYVDDVRVGPASDISQESFRPSIPSRVVLGPNIPNPFQRLTTIIYQLPALARVTVKTYSPDGREVKTLATGWQGPGFHVLRWNGTDEREREVPSGVYLCELTVEGESQTVKRCRKLVLSR
jgi:uncharacterized repeat protein (TIGR01451 family)